MKIKKILTESSVLYESLFALIGAILIAIAYLLQLWFLEDDLVVRILFAASFVIGGYFKAFEGISETIENKVLNVEILMILAALGAFFTGSFSEGAILILIFSISGALETYTTSKSEKELKALLNLAPNTATLVENGTEHKVAVSTLKKGDIVSVKVGEKIPVDGTIVKGLTAIDESSITGESLPVNKKINDAVFASTINQEGLIHVRCDTNPKDSRVQKIIDFVKEAQADQPKSQTRVDKIESIYVYVVIALAVLFMVVPPLFNWLSAEEAFYRGIVVLVVGSPCALVASISPAILSSLSNASSKKILIKGGGLLESLSDVKVVLFDKTGTLTKGKPEVKSVSFIENANLETIIPIIVALEKDSTHPLASAIVKHFKDVKKIDITSKEKPGQGLETTYENDIYKIGRFEGTDPKTLKKALDKSMHDGESIVRIYKNNEVIGFIGCADVIRDDAKNLVSYLNENGFKTVMITGDQEKTAQVIAKEIGINTVHSECYPEDKVTFVKAYQKEGHVMMIGDGINDAPALSLSEVAVSMGSGTDVSLETSDLVLIDNNLCNIKTSFEISRKTKRVITQNVIFSISVIITLLVVNTFGLILLPIGVIFHEGSTIMVILNSLRLIR